LVLSIQFGSLPFKNFHAGLLWERFAKSYPKVEEQPPIEPAFETFGTRQPAVQRISFQLPATPDTLRYWFVSEDDNQVLQVQGDRLVHNWRQRRPEDQYPRYESLRQRFEDEISVAASFFREFGLGEIACNQCEVSYINLIALSDGDAALRLSDTLAVCQEKYSDGFLAGMEMENGRFSVSYTLPGESGTQPIGRLHIAAQPAFLPPSGTMILRLTVTARGKPWDDTPASALAWLDIGRDVAVRAFASITTTKMHRLWGRRS
jgi:uncharacterized protein (TIGR04255 family)